MTAAGPGAGEEGKGCAGPGGGAGPPERGGAGLRCAGLRGGSQPGGGQKAALGPECPGVGKSRAGEGLREGRHAALSVRRGDSIAVGRLVVAACPSPKPVGP